MKKYDSACQDCRRALDMDQSLIKGHFFLGLSLMELHLYDEAIKHLQRGSRYDRKCYHATCLKISFSAQDLGKEQKLNFGDDIASQLRVARKKRWSLQEEKRIIQEIELQSYLNRLIKEDMQKQLEKLKIDDSVNETAKEDETAKIQEQCVSHELRQFQA